MNSMDHSAIASMKRHILAICSPTTHRHLVYSQSWLPDIAPTKALLTGVAMVCLAVSPASAQPPRLEDCLSSPTVACVIDQATTIALSLQEGSDDQTEALVDIGNRLATHKMADTRDVYRRSDAAFEKQRSEANTPVSRMAALKIMVQLIDRDRLLGKASATKDELVLIQEFSTLQSASDISIISFCNSLFDNDRQNSKDLPREALRSSCRSAAQTYLDRVSKEDRIQDVVAFFEAILLAQTLNISELNLSDLIATQIVLLSRQAREFDRADPARARELYALKTFLLLLQTGLAPSQKSYFLCEVEIRDALRRLGDELEDQGISGDKLHEIMDFPVVIGYGVLSDVATTQNLRSQKDALIGSIAQALKKRSFDTNTRLLMYGYLLDLLE